MTDESTKAGDPDLSLAPKSLTLALFDFDGTLTTHETMPVFVRRSVSTPRLVIWQLLLAPLVLGYKLSIVPGTLIRRAIVHAAYRGVPVATLEAAGAEFAQRYLPGALRPEAMQRLAWHQAQGHTVAVVSGGLDVYLAPWCAAHALTLICSRLQHENGLFTGHYQAQQCVGAEKARRIREHYCLSSFGTIYAYGDTPEDQELLDLAIKRYYRGQELA